MTSSTDTADATTTRPSRLPELSVRGVVGGCIAVLLFAVAAVIGWLVSPVASHALDAYSVLSAAAGIFAGATAIRGFGGLLLRPNPDPVAAIGVDLGLCVAALAAFTAIGSLADSNGIVLLTAAVGALFLLVFAFVASVVCELAAHFVWIARAALIGGGLAALAGLVAFSISVAG